jgi:transposase
VRSGRGDTAAVDEEDRPPICPRCGVTMVPAALSADKEHAGEWVCLECEEQGEDT